MRYGLKRPAADPRGSLGRASRSSEGFTPITGFSVVSKLALGHDAAEELLARTGRQLRPAASGVNRRSPPATTSPATSTIKASHLDLHFYLAGALVEAVAEPPPLPVGTVTLDAVGGIAYSPVPATSGVELLRQAIFAMEQARMRNLQADFYDRGT